jgi:NAD(P)-dependent dehydrogenase (short-subunit alcohol dehydrogenase family)
MVKKTVAEFGRLDAAYNNAGIQNVLAETADSPRDDYDRVMGVNLRGVLSCMKFELQVMREQGSGAIVNCSSLWGPHRWQPARNVSCRETWRDRFYQERGP